MVAETDMRGFLQPRRQPSDMESTNEAMCDVAGRTKAGISA